MDKYRENKRIGSKIKLKKLDKTTFITCILLEGLMFF